MKRTRMLPVLVALSVPALTAAQTPTPPTRTRPQMENTAGSGDMLQQACAPAAVLIAPAMPVRVAGGQERGRNMFGPNDSMVIGAGTKQGLQPGQEVLRQARRARSVHPARCGVGHHEHSHGGMGSDRRRDRGYVDRDGDARMRRRPHGRLSRVVRRADASTGCGAGWPAGLRQARATGDGRRTAAKRVSRNADADGSRSGSGRAGGSASHDLPPDARRPRAGPQRRLRNCHSTCAPRHRSFVSTACAMRYSSAISSRFIASGSSRRNQYRARAPRGA